jgi:transposase
MEATGHYTYDLCLFLEQQEVSYSVQSPLHLKRSFGLTHGKNDKVDAYRIASYAYLHREDIKLSQLATNSIRKLKALMAERKSLVVEIARCKAQLKEVGSHSSSPGTIKRTKELLEFLETQVQDIEKDMAQTIDSDAELKNNYQLLLTISGIGIVNAVNTIVATHNFKMFDNARQYASYIGVAPFEHTSGTSVRGKTHVEPGAKMLKADLTGAVRTCINHDKEIQKYYERKIAEGKSYGVVANAIKFKLLLRMFAVIKRGTPFVKKADHLI